MQLIRDEFKAGHTELAQGLLERLQFPLTLGGIKKSLDVGVHYIERLLSSRMFKDDSERAKKIAHDLVHGYSTHAFCIDCDEANRIGIKVAMLPDDQIDSVWDIRKLIIEKDQIAKKKDEEALGELLKELPTEVLKQLRDSRPKTGTDNKMPEKM